MIEDGAFRKDLYFRIGVIKIEVPSLNERQSDILLLAGHFLDEFAEKFDTKFTCISEQAKKALMEHTWTGNIRELKNLIERGVLIGKGPEMTAQDLGFSETKSKGSPSPLPDRPYPLIPPEGMDLSQAMQAFEKFYIDAAYHMAEGNESQAAKLLDINHHTYRYRRKKLLDL